MKPADRVEICLQHADIQDNLLQNYRNFLITLESVLLAVGVVILTLLISVEGFRRAVTLGALVLLSIFSIWVIRRGQRIVTARGRDVSYWHERVLENEQELTPPNRVFTEFKLHQKEHRRGHDKVVDDWFNKYENGEPLSKTEVHEVVHHGLSHTRHILDQMIPWALTTAWALLILIGWGISVIEYFGIRI
ncbi:MAG: hypothetical protein ACQETI_05795 [Halobacteriota archaeon]